MELINSKSDALREAFYRAKGKGDLEEANAFTEARYQLASLKNDFIDMVWK